ncbi:MAG: alpha/beta fold hydrolase, partial [Candidatus Angelobacter sp.]
MCTDSYRSSKEHADDVRKVMAKLRDEHGISKIYVMGHSMGTISSRWLAKNLGNEIAGSIHSSSMNGFNSRGEANSLSHFRYDAIAAPVLHVHNENDACPHTPYAIVKEYAGENLVTVRGGISEGDPCGAGHLHSHQGNEELVVRSIISWIKTKKVDRFIGH